MIVGSMSVGISFAYAKKFLSDIKIPTAALTSYQMILALLTISALTDFTGINAIRESNTALIGVVVEALVLLEQVSLIYCTILL